MLLASHLDLTLAFLLGALVRLKLLPLLFLRVSSLILLLPLQRLPLLTLRFLLTLVGLLSLELLLSRLFLCPLHGLLLQLLLTYLLLSIEAVLLLSLVWKSAVCKQRSGNSNQTQENRKRRFRIHS